MKVTCAPWKKEIGACAWMKSEDGRGQNGVRGVAAEGEVVDGVGVVEEVALMMIAGDVLETLVGAVGAAE